MFPEINYDKIDQIRGMDIIICTTAKTDAEAQGAARGLRHAVRGSDGARIASWRRSSKVEKNEHRRKLAQRFRAKRADAEKGE